MHTLNRPTCCLSLSFLCAIILLAGCEKPQPPQPPQPTTPPSSSSPTLKGQNQTDHTQYIPISKDGIDSLKVADPIMMRVERESTKPYPEAGYWLGLGPNKALSPSNKFATVTFDLEDLGDTQDKAAGVLVDQGWAMSIRKYLFPPPRSKRVSSGTGRDVFVATREAIFDGALSAIPSEQQPTKTTQPPNVAQDPEYLEILVYAHKPIGGTSIAEDWVFYRKVQGATKEVSYLGFNEKGEQTGEVKLAPGTWAIYKRAANTWEEMGEIPPKGNPPPIPGFESLLDEVLKTTGRSFYKQVSGGSNPTDPADPPSSTNPSNPSDSAPK